MAKDSALQLGTENDPIVIQDSSPGSLVRYCGAQSRSWTVTTTCLYDFIIFVIDFRNFVCSFTDSESSADDEIEPLSGNLSPETDSATWLT